MRTRKSDMRILKRVAVYVAAAILVACSGSPTAPSPPPNIQGQWTGGYLVTACQESGAAIGSGFCQSLGSGSQVVLTPQQAGTAITGTLGIGAFSPIPISGTLDQSVVSLAGSGPIQLGATFALNQWRGTLSGNTISGALQYTITTGAPIGSATVTGSFTIQK